jgi:hypothetical protein
VDVDSDYLFDNFLQRRAFRSRVSGRTEVLGMTLTDFRTKPREQSHVSSSNNLPAPLEADIKDLLPRKDKLVLELRLPVSSKDPIMRSFFTL